MVVTQDHAAIEAHFASGACGDGLKLGGIEVGFLYAVLLGQKLQGERLHRLGLHLVTCLFALLDDQGAIANQDVQVLTCDDLGSLLAHLVLCQVNEQVGNAEHGIARLVAHVDVDDGAVLLHHDAIQRQRNGYPLVMLDAAIVMSVKANLAVCLEQRVLLDIKTRGVDVRAQDVHAVLDGIAAQLDEDDGLAVRGGVHLIARLQGLTCAVDVFDVAIAGGLRTSNGALREQTLGLVLRDEIDVVSTERLELGQRRLVVSLPCVLLVHEIAFLIAFPIRSPIIAHSAPARRAILIFYAQRRFPTCNYSLLGYTPNSRIEHNPMREGSI